MDILDLCGNWEFSWEGCEKSLPCTVPGSAASTLLAHGMMPDPYWRDNETKVQQLLDRDYTFSRTFYVSAEALRHTHGELCFRGLDTVARIEINGTEVGRADNMHRTWFFPCLDALREGENTLRVCFRSPMGYLREHPATLGKRFTTIRKAACMFGWDWGLELPDSGIWQAAELHLHDHGRLTAGLLRQIHENGTVTILVTPAGERISPECRIRLTLTDPHGKPLEEKICLPGEKVALTVSDPELWWPADSGAQPLYTLDTELLLGDNVLHSLRKRLGLRTIHLDRSADGDGWRYRFLVNGKDIFFRGENLIIPDAIISRTDSAWWKRLIRDCRLSNLNGIRVWGGAYYPPEEFFDLCDEAGILVYQDLMFACSFYALSADFLENIRLEMEDNISRIAHHASLALLCGNNEIDGIYTVGGSLDPETAALRVLFGASPDPLPEQTRRFLWSQYAPLFLELIPKVCEKWAPDVCYVPSSPSLPEPGAANSFFDYLAGGDMHYYLQYNGNAPYQKMRTMRSRFMSEIGFQSYPDMKTILGFTEPEDRLPYTPVMYAHQKCANGNEAIELYMERDYTVPKDFWDYVFLSQVQAGQIMAYTVEHFRRDSGYCRGIALWQLNDCWPVVSWSGIDYHGRWKALQYYIRRFFAPVLASAEDKGLQVDLWLSNESPKAAAGCFTWQLLGPEGVLETGEAPASAAPGESRCCATLDFTEKISEEALSGTCLRWQYGDQDGTVFFVLPKDFRFRKPHPQVTVEEREDGFLLRLRSDCLIRCLGITTKEGDAIFSDNYFDLSPGQERSVFAPRQDCRGFTDAAALKAALELNTLNDVLLRAGEV